MSNAMTVAERNAFLGEARVAVLSIADGDNGPLAVPVWYDFAPDKGVWFITPESSHKGRLLAAVGRCSLTVQSETAPYRYVSIEGPVAHSRSVDVDADLRPMARRYLGPEGGDAYADAFAGTESQVYRLTPERWRTVDYAKR